MSKLIEQEFGINVFEDAEISINLLIGQNSSAVDFIAGEVRDLLDRNFHIYREDHDIIIPNKEEVHSYQVTMDTKNGDLFSIELEYLLNEGLDGEEQLLKDISMSANPRIVATFLKVLLKKYPNEGLLYGMLEMFFVNINRDLLREDLNTLSDEEISNRLYEPLPSDHLLYKINNGGWVDNSGTFHKYPEG
ncbi:hypothetical protein ACQU0X_32040 [Pseudovibrio ascidiaceicola]|uniref:hypothetical protein n=1 Tax=Pseudovibrio ascidiaceicola TaxID=285279 RepID=UPI003D35D84B